MSNSSLDIIKKRIVSRHSGDEKQIEVIFSSSSRLLVEAPAGYGKTNTMVSKVAYMLATHQIPSPKKLLALTFSVNAAYKMKKDVIRDVPLLLEETGLGVNVTERVFVTNYHGFCRNVLKKYGYKYHDSLFDIDKLQSIDDSDPKNISESAEGTPYESAQLLSTYSSELRNANESFLIDHFDEYNSIVIKELLPRGVLPYNAIISLTIRLFADYPNILGFYQKYFTAILVDEFQDTNILSYWLLACLIGQRTKVILLGDSLQRIYGFIGAVPNLLTIAKDKFSLTKIQLSRNHRFATNAQMLQLDLNIRRNAENPYSPVISEDATIDLKVLDDQDGEAVYIVRKAISLTQDNLGSKVAILVKQRGSNINRIVKEFDDNQVPYFFGLFTDEDVEYIKFHRKCLFEFIELIKAKDIVTKKLATAHTAKINAIYDSGLTPFIEALINLLNIFWNKIFSDYSFISNEDKIMLIKDTFEHNGLKQYIEFVNADIVISTVHAAKGLEWDFVILPDMEQNSFPNWYGLCGKCPPGCTLTITGANVKNFLEELSVFYVAVTRAKKHVFFSASRRQLDRNGISRPRKLSCFLSLPGIRC